MRQIPERARAAAAAVASERAHLSQPAEAPRAKEHEARVHPPPTGAAADVAATVANGAAVANGATVADGDAVANGDVTDRAWFHIASQVGGGPTAVGRAAGRHEAGAAGAPVPWGAIEVEEAAAVMRGLRERLQQEANPNPNPNPNSNPNPNPNPNPSPNQEEAAVQQRRAARAQRKAQRRDAGAAAAAAVERALPLTLTLTLPLPLPLTLTLTLAR